MLLDIDNNGPLELDSSFLPQSLNLSLPQLKSFSGRFGSKK